VWCTGKAKRGCKTCTIRLLTTEERAGYLPRHQTKPCRCLAFGTCTSNGRRDIRYLHTYSSNYTCTFPNVGNKCQLGLFDYTCTPTRFTRSRATTAPCTNNTFAMYSASEALHQSFYRSYPCAGHCPMRAILISMTRPKDMIDGNECWMDNFNSLPELSRFKYQNCAIRVS